MRLPRLSVALLAAGTAAALAAVAPAAANAAPAPGTTPGTAAVASTKITLLTGDRVSVTRDGRTSIERGPGRAGTRFLSHRAGQHQYVIPADALPLIRAGRLDRRLFDLTALREFGYTGEAELPLLLAYPRSGSRKGPAGAKAATGATARGARDLSGVGMLAVRAQRTARAGLWTSLTTGTPTARSLRPGVERIYLDGKRKLDLDVSVPQIGAPSAWQAGLDGSGVTVAVLDSGIDAAHPDFAGRIVANENFTTDPNADDVVGHGTHVASIIAGSGAKSGGKYRGVAPGAKLAIGKVCETDFCEDSAVLAGMQWAARTAPVINISLGGGDTAGLDPLEQAVDDLSAAHGALFVISAGNAGGTATVGSPGSADAALTVGAVDDEDQLADFSSRGPRVGDDAIKPDITAPGVEIVAARAANGEIGTPAADGYVGLSGTSMAAPHVAGAAAIVAQQHPGWTGEQRKALLMGAAQPAADGDAFGQGAGRVDVARVVRQTVSVEEASISFGRQLWPHGDDVPLTRTVTYRNGGTAPITLALTLADESDTFSVAATSLTVPAGGTASTTVTADTSGAGPDGLKSARLVATGPGDVRVTTPVAVNREVESYDVTLRHLGRDGQATDHFTSFHRLGVFEFHEVFSDAATEVIRLPKGEYGYFSWIYGAEDMTMLVQPRFVVAGPVTLVLDARRSRPVDVTVPRPDAKPALIAVNADWVSENGAIGGSAVSETGTDLFLGQVGPRTRQPGFSGSVNAAFARPDPAGEGFRDTPYLYSLAYLNRGAFYTGFTKHVRARELATVHSRFAREAEGASGLKLNWPTSADGIGGWAVGIPFALPSQRTEWLSTEPDYKWAGEFDQEVPAADPEGFPDTLSIAFGPDRRYRAGASYREDWNRAVFAPSTAGDINAAVRFGDLIVAGVPLFSDGDGHWGDARTDTARTALYSGGTLIGETAAGYGEFEVPPGGRAYRLEQSATRGAPFRLSTSVSAAWTFRSAPSGDPEALVRLPLSTVRFSPPVDQHNVVPAGRTVTVPVTVERTSGSPARPNRKLTVEFSTDDGRTWQPATVRGSGDRRTVRITGPAGFVSLRANAVDAAGNTSAVTVLRAYEVR